ncbi:MAG TPA: hypothetical protein VMT20_01470 [Terriglobia bacterium]|nr:hypothetical protein [Terriglobia bacterium]
MATAFVFEIDYIYRFFVEEHRDWTVIPLRTENLILELTNPLSFAVYSGGAPLLGQLDPEVVAHLVQFYAEATLHMNKIRDLLSRFQRAQERPLGENRWEGLDEYNRWITSHLPKVRLLAAEASKNLCARAGISFDPQSVAVAAEDVNRLRLEVKNLESAQTSVFEVNV